MRPNRALFILCAIFGVAIPAFAMSGPTIDELEHNRRLLAAWRKDPEHYARLWHDLEAFRRLPARDRERMRRLDRELNETDAAKQKHLRGVLERYAAWLERLPEADQKRIATTDRSERLLVVRELRERQYLDSLPEKAREQLAQLSEPQQRSQLERFRREERQLRLTCLQIAKSQPEVTLVKPVAVLLKPTRLEEFPANIRTYVDDVLWHQIKEDEADQIKKAEGAPWPLLARTILELSTKHPVKLPGPPTGPSRYKDLPTAFHKLMPQKDLSDSTKSRLNSLLGKWPEFAAEYTAVARQRGVTLPHQLGPSHPKDFASPITQFINRTLTPKLTTEEKDNLKSNEGRWPDYPRLLLELAKKHKLEVPLMHLPGPRELWDRARAD